ncbi:MAG: NAD(P)-dependent alcohol dehydrogenase [Oscillatoriales cyanobacterium SM2_2_1]|nr:NAD(P)-dependent alcohol dehydrogenase [Oscillatoriales cyanobacterium SM2_2_1]
MNVQAFAATALGEPLTPFTYELPPLGDRQVDITVESCGICHSDLSMLHNHWGITQYPFVPGHEVVGIIASTGDRVTQLQVGQRVGLGWFSHSCGHCHWCMTGDHNLCQTAEQTIVGRHGGFADVVRAYEEWVIPLPESLDPLTAGPMFCGGITVFNPIIQHDIKPTDHVGVIGIGGLGHLALKFLRAWGCAVTAFTSTPAKADEARRLGADRVIDSRDPQALANATNSLDLILCTANANLDWGKYIAALRPKGRLHFVGVVPSAIETHVFPLIAAQKSLSGSPLGSPEITKQMLDFAARHRIAPEVETFSFSAVNEALAHLESGKARYRIVLKH